MAQTPKARWVKVGKQIRASRERAGLSLEDLAGRIDKSATMLSAMERGACGIKQDHVERIDRALGTGKILADAWDRSSGSGLPAWYQKAADRERAASEIREYHPLLIPGLLQTADYARTLLRAGLPTESPAEIEDLTRARMERQTILAEEKPPRLLVVLDESVLRRPFGSRETMKRQLDHLLEASEQPHVTLQVVPFDPAIHPGVSNSFTLYTMPEMGRQILWVETRRSGDATDDEESVSDYTRLYADLMAVGLPPVASQRVITEIEGEA